MNNMDFPNLVESLKQQSPEDAWCGTDGLMDQAAKEIKRLTDKLSSRTFALLHAIDLGQRSVFPSVNSINQWRKALGWHTVSESTLLETARTGLDTPS